MPLVPKKPLILINRLMSIYKWLQTKQKAKTLFNCCLFCLFFSRWFFQISTNLFSHRVERMIDRLYYNRKNQARYKLKTFYSHVVLTVICCCFIKLKTCEKKLFFPFFCFGFTWKSFCWMNRFKKLLLCRSHTPSQGNTNFQIWILFVL